MHAAVPAPTDLLECAVTAARTAGEHALRNRHRRREAIETFAHDVKLALDVECQEIAIDVIRGRFPGAHVLAEEKQLHESAAAGRVEWIVDPIDGTINFSHGMPLWCCSVAARRDGEPLAGAVFAPELDDLYTATAGAPARCNDEPIHVSDTARLEEAIALVSLYRHDPGDPPALPVLAQLAERARKIRAMGSAALDMCHVARGRADVYWEPGIYLWDLAAAGLIARQAGGTAEVLDDSRGLRVSYLVSNGRLHDEFKQLLLDALQQATVKGTRESP